MYYLRCREAKEELPSPAARGAGELWGEQPKLLCLLQSRGAAPLLQQPHWEVFFPLTLQQTRQELCGAWGMQHSVQGLPGGRGCAGPAAAGGMTRGAQRVCLGSQRGAFPAVFLPGRCISSGLMLQVDGVPVPGKTKVVY